MMRRLLFGFSIGALAIPFIATAATCPTLSRTLSQGIQGEDVRQLQQFLIEGGDLAPGNATGYFGPLTRAAVQRFQCRKGVSCPGGTGSGVVDAPTRAAIAGACGAPRPAPSGPFLRLPVTPPICLLTADPAFVSPGASSTLRWNSSGTSAALWPFGVASTSGARSVAPTTTMTYLLVAVDGFQSVSMCSATVTVAPSSSPPLFPAN